MRLLTPLTAAFSVVLLLSLSAPTAQAEPACGTADAACEVALGGYHIALPKSASSGPIPVVLHFHGAGGTGSGVIRNNGMIKPILERGYAVIAPNGLGREGRRGGFWSFIPGRPIRRDELAFTRQVLNDAVERFELDRSRVLLTGFSIGGSLTWYLACQAPDDFAAYAPVAGGFWRPHPTDCAGPIKMLHTHGWRDSTVPLEGRPIRGGEIHQGDIFQGLRLWRAENGCTGGRPDRFNVKGRFWRRTWTTSDPGTALQMAMHDGAHGVPKGWSTMALDWFESVVPVKGTSK
ncbi:MAG: dienelactone hydrolase family protein [Alphaproteobacteria bacterium]|nr:dienelactone hydrolase family protein [Alphaproteobacteria bacterium]